MFEIGLEGWALVALGFLLLYGVELRRNDATLVDAGWAASLGGLALYFSFRGPGLFERRILMAVLVCAWAARLTLHIVRRHRGDGEDSRYRRLRERYGDRAHHFFFVFYQAQALLAAVLSIPFLLIASDASAGFHVVEVLGAALVLVGITGEATADRQLARHRADPANRGKTCRSGLWRYSRHPNYFFEWLVWCGFGIGALSAPMGAAALLSPLLMLFSIVKVTGIPPTEESALQSRGEDYRRYQRTTSAFVPWFPRKESA
jgi:steroid 5-alpha reductase family enzyme